MKHWNWHFLLGCALAVASGCASPPSRFYTLTATAKAEGVSGTNYAVAVGAVSVPASVDRPQVVLTVAPNRVELEEFDRWAEPLEENIKSVICSDLNTLLGADSVVSSPMADFGSAFHVAIHVKQFESARGDAKTDGHILLEAVWTLRGPDGKRANSGQTLVKEPAPGDTIDALAAAHSRALAKLSDQIADDIRKAAAEQK